MNNPPPLPSMRFGQGRQPRSLGLANENTLSGYIAIESWAHDSISRPIRVHLGAFVETARKEMIHFFWDY